MLGTTILVLTFILLYVYKNATRRIVVKNKTKSGIEVRLLKQAPGPIAWPILGSLHLLGGDESPFQTFTKLAKIYGDIFSIKLGSASCLVVNNLELITEVLNKNGKFLGGRPDFMRFNELFDGDRNNSLALCDWSNLQLKRRNLARQHCAPKQHTDHYSRIGDVATFESIELVNTLRGIVRETEKMIQLKPFLMSAAMNMFSSYMCSIRFDAETDTDFRKTVDTFDKIFWEINQGYAVDFLPWLSPFYKEHMKKLSNWSKDIRSFIISRIVDKREMSLDVEEPETDFLDGMLRVLRDDPTVDRNTIIFMLEDFLGGHASVGNLVMMSLAAIVRDPEVGTKVREEIEAVTEGERAVTLDDRSLLPYTEATILECLRFASSPIVPHVATENASIAGFGVEEGTVVFINNYELNTSDTYWTNPEKFDPSRFLEKSNIRTKRHSCGDSGMESDADKSIHVENPVMSIKKNIPHFLPFSIGKRTCMGKTLLMATTFVMFANLMQEFAFGAENLEDLRQKPATVALPKDTFGLYVTLAGSR